MNHNNVQEKQKKEKDVKILQKIKISVVIFIKNERFIKIIPLKFIVISYYIFISLYFKDINYNFIDLIIKFHINFDK